METLLEFAKHNQVKKTLNEWSKEDKKQKDDKFWNDYYMSTVPRISIQPLYLMKNNVDPDFFRK